MIKNIYEIFLKNNGELIYHNRNFYFCSTNLLALIHHDYKNFYFNGSRLLAKYGQFRLATEKEMKRLYVKP